MESDESDYFENYFFYEDEAYEEIDNLVTENIPMPEFNCNDVLDECEKRFYYSLHAQVKYLESILDKYDPILKELNKKIEEHDMRLERLNNKRKLAGKLTYNKEKETKLRKLRDSLHGNWEIIKEECEKKRKILETILGEGRELQSDRNPSAKTYKLELPTRKQHMFYGSKKLFQSLLKQLSLHGNGFIDEESANNWEFIYNDHFTGDIDDWSKENKINLKEALSAFEYFYDKFFENYFVGMEGYTVFFEAHFLHHGKEKSANDIKPRNKCQKNNQIKLDRIFECLESIKK